MIEATDSAETIGRLNQKFFGRRVGKSVGALQNDIACVFKKFAEANARWYDAGERVGVKRLAYKNYQSNSTPRSKYAGYLLKTPTIKSNYTHIK